jgi:hypothetical protein
MRMRARKLSYSAALMALASAVTLPAAAQSTIKQPGQRPPYYVELEPHGLLGVLDPPGFGDDLGFGLGARATIELASAGFLPKLNDSVGLGFGFDYVRYDGYDGWRSRCTEFLPDPPNGVPICVRTDGAFSGHVDYFYVPVVMQWNFWLHRKWSVFGEPGIALYWEEGDFDFTPVVLFAGGRFHFNDRITLTMRLGYPTFSLGVSFLL